MEYETWWERLNETEYDSSVNRKDLKFTKMGTVTVTVTGKWRILMGRGGRGWNGPRVRRNEGKGAEDEKTNPSRDRGGTEHLLHHSRQQRRVLLQHLRHDRHQYHLFHSLFQQLLRAGRVEFVFGNRHWVMNEVFSLNKMLEEEKKKKSKVTWVAGSIGECG